MRILGLLKSIGKRPRSQPLPPPRLAPRISPLRIVEQALAQYRESTVPESAHAAPAADPPAVALLLIGLDRFRLVNELCGHAAGDSLLDTVRDRCARALHADSAHGGAIVHIGGDEFACLLPLQDDGCDQAHLDRLAETLLETIGTPVSLGRHIIHLTASIGMAVDRGSAISAEELLRGASIALSHAKDAGDRRVRRFSHEMFAFLSERAALEEDLRSGLLRGELVPYYQPIVALPSREIVRFEALVRWHHPQRGVLGPDRFLSMAEDVGLNDDLLYAMLRQSCRDAQGWGDRLGLSINMSPRQVCDPDIASRLLRIVFASGIRPERLTVEITENAVMHNVVAAQATVASLREAGIKVALDDFGTGYASLSRICKLPLDMIKIDRTLVEALASDAGCKLVKVVVDLGQSLSMPVTAEGIETEQQARALSELGCAFGQGYLFGRAAPSGETALRAHKGMDAVAS
ncbi:putative bifunctional diguanylate cyclase/phosphodiesterase [Novosphingobium sp.]|jgi:diguanylate cyclase (GGDEF)-like protein|uniref:putative bifunctional diguanylate cyclase/phosphodiesterase n=1 Tax=Novosphingobium sp. TaxID=1874826 RepID=UPI002FE424AE